MDKENINNNDLANIIAEGVSKALKDTQIRIVNESKMDMSVVACARTLKNFCKSHNRCPECIFLKGSGCILNRRPEDWDID